VFNDKFAAMNSFCSDNRGGGGRRFALRCDFCAVSRQQAKFAAYS
jgi:hypothetical protein